MAAGETVIERSPDEAELRSLLAAAKSACGLSYESLAERAHVSRGTARNYLTGPGSPARGDSTIMARLLGALAVSATDRARALELHRRLHPRAGTGRDTTSSTAWRSRARAAGCAVWTMAEFTPSEAAVHTAIGRRHTSEGEPPPYVPRDYDRALRADMSAAATGELRALILLRGTSSTGKTRSLFEAVRTVCPDREVLRPRTVAALLGLPGADLLDRPVVVWLNELQGFLGPTGAGLSRELLRDLFARAGTPPVVVGTIWPERMRFLAVGNDDRGSESRELLLQHNQWVRWLDVPSSLSPGERATARDLARTDPRLAAALNDRDRVGFAQTLAGAHELLNHYDTAPRLARIVLEAAADARRLGVRQVLPAPMLDSMTVSLWRLEHGDTSLPAGGFDAALTYVTAPIRSEDGVRALIPLDDDDGEPGEYIGYTLADYLEQHLTPRRASRPVIDGEWTALAGHVREPEELLALARAAENRGRVRHTETLLRASGRAGLGRLADWLSKRPGREQEAEVALIEAAAAGDPEVLPTFRRWFRGGRREVEAEAVLRHAAATGDPQALRNLTAWFGQTRGQEHQAEAVIHRAAEGGDIYLLLDLGDWLIRQPGREREAEETYREAAARGYHYALLDVAHLLGGQPGRENDAITAFRDAAAAGVKSALLDLAVWLGGRPGREDEAEAAYREAETAYRAAAASEPRALYDLAEWLGGRPGREHQAEAVYREAAAGGNREALHRLAFRLCRQPGREHEGEAVYRECAAAGDPQALRLLAEWLRTRPGREHEAEQAYREAAAAGDRFALRALAARLTEQPGREREAEAVYREAAEEHGPHALNDLADWLRGQPGREDDAEAVYREAAAAGYPDALYTLAKWLGERPGRERDAEAVHRAAAAAGHSYALNDIADLLRRRPGREAELRAFEQHGLDAFGATAQPG